MLEGPGQDISVVMWQKTGGPFGKPVGSVELFKGPVMVSVRSVCMGDALVLAPSHFKILYWLLHILGLWHHSGNGVRGSFQR